MDKPETISLYQFFKQFPDENSARLYFENNRWSGGKACPHCGSVAVSECKDHRPMAYRCKDCRKHFSVRTGTVLEESKLPLQKWLMAIYMMTTARKGIPSTQMARELGCTQKSAWFLAQRIRECWLSGSASDVGGGGKLGGTVEVDEAFIGGKETNKHASKRVHKGHGSDGKAIVVGIKQRDGVVIAKRVPDTTAMVLQSFITNNVARGSTVYTDSANHYKSLRGFHHDSVNHSVGEYVRNQTHTNGIESFWALLKRSHYGIHHYMSHKHLHRYVNEAAFRHNTKTLATMKFIDATIGQMNDRRLTYKDLING